MSRITRLTNAVADHTRLAIVVMLVLTLVIGSGAGMVEQTSSLDAFQSDNVEQQKLEYITANFSTGTENTTSAQLILRGENVLTKDTLLATLQLEQRFRENETIAPTLAGENSMTGVANVVATAAIRGEQARELRADAAQVNATSDALRDALDALRANESASVRAQFDGVRANAPSYVDLNESDYGTFNRSATMLRDATNESQARRAYRLGTQGVLATEYAALEQRQTALQSGSSPTLAEQRAQLESMNASELDRAIRQVLNGDADAGGAALGLMPTSYDPGSTEANASMLLVSQRTDGTGAPGSGSASDSITESQLAMQTLADDAGNEGGFDVVVFGAGVITEEINNSMSDSLLIVGPLALLFVMLALLVAYRDLIDIALGLFGVVAVLIWTFGFMGWTDINFNQIFIAVPVLLIGLSIDYAIHIFMRHREERETLQAGVRKSMTVALAGVGVALVWVTATTVIGFLSNLTSPVPPIQDFGVVSAVGITAALLVFGVLIPAMKVEVDEFLEGRGWDRRKAAFGTGGGRFSSMLAAGSTAAQKAPWILILLTVLVSAGGAYGATQVDTSFNQQDFLADDPPDWMKDLPEPFAPGDYNAKENLNYVYANFATEDSQAQILVEGDVAGDGTLTAIADAEARAAESNVTTELAGGGADVRSPVSVIQQVAAQNESFNATVAAADTDGDGVPDRNIESVYDELYRTAPDQAASVIQRTEGGEYPAVRMVVSVRGDASGDAVTTEMRAVATDITEATGLQATATGQRITFKIVQDQLLETVIESLIITLVAVFAFLMVTYRITEGSATLGAITLLPVVFSVAWILGTMYLLDIPFNVLTGMITSLTVGLGVAYSIHLSERYNQELERTGDVWESMHRAVTGTGGALLGSAATTVGGFGVLTVSILPPLQQFGLITGMTIIYAFLASVLVLPSLLVVWTRFATEHDTAVDATTGGE